MSEHEVVTLMESSKSDAEWNANADRVKRECGGYPSFWYAAVILSGVADRTAKAFGSDAAIHIHIEG